MSNSFILLLKQDLTNIAIILTVKKEMHYKNDPILETDLVLIYVENDPAFYARVERISNDIKPKWWRVQFLFLTVPVQLATWILDEEQIRGAEFTMNGTPVRVEKVVIPEDRNVEENDAGSTENKTKPGKKARVLSFQKK